MRKKKFMMDPQPFLEILEPNPTYKFRYGTETNGSHGKIYSQTDKTKCPQVTLRGYKGVAIIRTSLCQADANCDPDSLLIHSNYLIKNGDKKTYDPYEDDASESNEYTVKCENCLIIRTTKNDANKYLKKKLEKFGLTSDEKIGSLSQGINTKKVSRFPCRHFS